MLRVSPGCSHACLHRVRKMFPDELLGFSWGLDHPCCHKGQGKRPAAIDTMMVIAIPSCRAGWKWLTAFKNSQDPFFYYCYCTKGATEPNPPTFGMTRIDPQGLLRSDVARQRPEIRGGQKCMFLAGVFNQHFDSSPSPDSRWINCFVSLDSVFP